MKLLSEPGRGEVNFLMKNSASDFEFQLRDGRKSMIQIKYIYPALAT